MSLNLNKVILGGRITADIELKQTAEGTSVIQFNLAVNRKPANEGEKSADFISCVAWRTTAEFISRHFKKGSPICVIGAIQTRNWTDNKGQKRYATEVVVNEALFVASSGAESNAPQYTNAEPTKFENISTDDDVPF